MQWHTWRTNLRWKILEKPNFVNMDKTTPLNTSMVIRSLDVIKDPFSSWKDDEENLGPEIPYLSAIEAFLYLANCTRPNISFVISLL